LTAKFDRKALVQNQERADHYHNRLMGAEGRQVREYLEGRGIGCELTILYKLGLCDDVHDGWISIPYLREPHGVIWFNYRNLSGKGSKYMATGAKHLYNTTALDQADETGEIAIAEGEFDAIVATELCGVPAVAIPGATQWISNRHWHELFVGYQRVWVLADPDEAGLGLASEILDLLPAARLVNLPSDVTDTYLKHGGIKEFIRG
jgi:DNA primase